jgi:ABC-type nitrate/sulfonate/bicarbonate transport system permease component
MTAAAASRAPGSGRGTLLRTVRAGGRALLTGLGTVVVVLILWWGSLAALQVPSFVGKGPQDVWAYLFVVPVASENRTFVIDRLSETLIDAAIGFSFGLGAALLLAAVFLIIRPVEQALMPILLVLQSIPLIALAPIVTLIFGRDVVTVAVMGALVVVFPALVTIVFGLRSVSPYMVELVQVYGGGMPTVLRKVSLPSALPALFAAIRIAVPGAITGALVAEWLATGGGIGRAIIAAVAQAKMSEVWTLAAIITLTSIVFYSIASAVESTVLARLGMERVDQ